MHKTSSNNTTPIALTIAGSDSGGGAGIQADIKTFSALQTYGASVITAVTAQNTCGVSAVEEVSETLIRAQIMSVLDDLNVAAIKIGMLGSETIIDVVTGSLGDCDLPIVLDPVMVSKSGDALLQDNAITALCCKAICIANLLTPNLPEAARLLQTNPATNELEMEHQGRRLLEMGAGAVLMKGGHAQGAQCVDVLIQPNLKPVRLVSDRINTNNTHGTGCTLSAAVTAGLAHGLSLESAVKQAHNYLAGAIKTADSILVGRGHGPVHHFYRQW